MRSLDRLESEFEFEFEFELGFEFRASLRDALA